MVENTAKNKKLSYTEVRGTVLNIQREIEKVGNILSLQKQAPYFQIYLNSLHSQLTANTNACCFVRRMGGGLIQWKN